MSKKFEVVTGVGRIYEANGPLLEQKLRHRDAMSSVYDPRWRDNGSVIECHVAWFRHLENLVTSLLPALCLPGLEDWKNTLSILTLLLPLPPPHEPCLHPNPCWWSGLSFFWNQHWLLVCGWLHLSTHPNQCCDSVLLSFEKEGCPAQRGRGTSTRAHYCLTFHESVYTAHVHWLFFCLSEQGLQFP